MKLCTTFDRPFDTFGQESPQDALRRRSSIADKDTIFAIRDRNLVFNLKRVTSCFRNQTIDGLKTRFLRKCKHSNKEMNNAKAKFTGQQVGGGWPGCCSRRNPDTVLLRG